MPLYEDRRNAENKIVVPAEWRKSIAVGPEAVTEAILHEIMKRSPRGAAKHTVTAAFDGWYGVDWPAIIRALRERAKGQGVRIEFVDVASVFKSPHDIAAYKTKFTVTDDPGFGVVNDSGVLKDLMDAAKVEVLRSHLASAKSATGGTAKVAPDALVVFGPGAAVPDLGPVYDLRFYFDKTRQPVLWQMWDGKLVPFGETGPRKAYDWKEYYYCDYYLLHRQKDYAFEHMDFYVEAVKYESLKLVLRAVYDGVMKTAVRYPVKEVKIFQPGPWGAYRYRDLWEIPGLGCNAWNELAGPELAMLLDLGEGVVLDMPMVNLMQYAALFVGPLLHETYPGLFPLDVWLDDGYFPEPTPAERISMPIHNHPGTDYVRRHFCEPLGRYETYYIVEAYEDANTWMGFHEEANLEDWEAKCRESWAKKKPIPDWKDYVANWPTNVGDLFLIPPGTTHGHGGNQMVLEMDTCPSVAATEYSFFMYDFMRPSWDDRTKTMTGKPVNMHLEHGFDNEKWRRTNWVKGHLLAKPVVVKWTKEYSFDRYTSWGPMPFEIERFHFKRRAENSTEGRFIHVLTLAVGNRVAIRSKKDPSISNEIEWFQTVLVPACMGEYEIENLAGGQATVVQLRWKKG